MRKALLATLVVVAILVGAGWLADTLVRRTAEDRVATAVQQRLALTQPPEVSLGGFPFSLAFLTRSVPDARASAGRVPLTVGGKDVFLTGVRVETGTVRLVGDRAYVDRVDATGVLGYGDLSEIAGIPVTSGGNGRLKLVYTATIQAVRVTIGITAVPRLDDDGSEVRLTEVELDPGTNLPFPVSGSLLERLARPIPVRLAGGARLTALNPSEGGVAVAVRAGDLSFAIA